MNLDENILIKKINKIIQYHDKILVGFSGGLDSTVLLHLLIKINQKTKKNIKIRAIHINHNISENSEKWNEHCKEICLKWKINFISEKIYTYNTKKIGIECAARNARYKILKKIHLPKEIIVLGHHLNDQIETFLLALKRGSGSKGLSGMSTFTKFSKTQIIRPLLFLEKKKILYYAKKNSLNWIEDETNNDIKYDRNFLRSNIIPIFNKRWPYFIKSVEKSLNIFKNQEILLNELIDEKLKKITSKKGAIKIKYLKKYSEKKKNIIFRYWFYYNKLPKPSYIQLKEINKKLNSLENKKNIKINLNNCIIYLFKKKLWILPKLKDITKISLKCKIPSKIKLPDNMGFLIFNKKNGTTIRKPNKNEKIFIKFGLNGNIKIKKKNKTIRIKKIWQKFNIPPILRTRIPLIYYNDKLISAINIFVTKYGKNNLKNNKIKIKWIKNDIYKKLIEK